MIPVIEFNFFQQFLKNYCHITVISCVRIDKIIELIKLFNNYVFWWNIMMRHLWHQHHQFFKIFFHNCHPLYAEKYFDTITSLARPPTGKYSFLAVDVQNIMSIFGAIALFGCGRSFSVLGYHLGQKNVALVLRTVTWRCGAQCTIF